MIKSVREGHRKLVIGNVSNITTISIPIKFNIFKSNERLWESIIFQQLMNTIREFFMQMLIAYNTILSLLLIFIIYYYSQCCKIKEFNRKILCDSKFLICINIKKKILIISNYAMQC